MKVNCSQHLKTADSLVKEASQARLETDVLLHVIKHVLRKHETPSFKCSANHANCIGCYKSIESKLLSKFKIA